MKLLHFWNFNVKLKKFISLSSKNTNYLIFLTIIITKLMNIYIESINDSEESSRVEIFLSLLILALSWTDKKLINIMEKGWYEELLEHVKFFGGQRSHQDDHCP